MPSNDPTQTTDKPEPTQAEDLDTFLRGLGVDPDRYTQHKDGSVSVTVIYAYQEVDKGDTPGPKVVKFRPMYAGDYRKVTPEHDIQRDLLHATILNLADIEEHDLVRMHLADYEYVMQAATGILEKKFRPTS